MKIKFLPSVMFALPLLLLVHWARAAAATPVSPPASSTPPLRASPARMKQWNDWRLGLFIHWGPWSQMARGSIWEMTNTKSPLWTRAKFDAELKLGNTFKPEHFDPAEWARLARAAGFEYLVFTAKHHDGYANWDTALSDYRSTGPDSPAQVDFTRAIVEAFRRENFAIGLYYSHIDWHHPDGRYFSRSHPDYDDRRLDTDPASWQRFADFETGQVRELLSNYGKIDILWFDISWPRLDHPLVKASVASLLRTVRTLQPDIILSDRGIRPYGDFTTPEQFIPDCIEPGVNWESSVTLTEGRGYWFKGAQASGKTLSLVIRLIVEAASKGGNLLLDVGPGPDGRLAPSEIELLHGLAGWMKVNGESIHGTTPSGMPRQPWGYSTAKENKVYLHITEWTAGNTVLGVYPMVRHIRRAYLLEDHRAVKFDQVGPQVDVTLPEGVDPTLKVVVLDCDPLAGPVHHSETE